MHLTIEDAADLGPTGGVTATASPVPEGLPAQLLIFHHGDGLSG